MALSNKERVGRVLDALREGLGPFIVREYRMFYKDRYLDEIQPFPNGGIQSVPNARNTQLTPIDGNQSHCLCMYPIIHPNRINLLYYSRYLLCLCSS